MPKDNLTTNINLIRFIWGPNIFKMQVVIASCSVKPVLSSFYLEPLTFLCFEKSTGLFNVKGFLFLDIEIKEKV